MRGANRVAFESAKAAEAAGYREAEDRRRDDG
jgi:hypothetical protein